MHAHFLRLATELCKWVKKQCLKSTLTFVHSYRPVEKKIVFQHFLAGRKHIYQTSVLNI